MPKIKTKHQKLLYALLLYQREWLGKKDSQNNGQEMALKWLKIAFSLLNQLSKLPSKIYYAFSRPQYLHKGEKYFNDLQCLN